MTEIALPDDAQGNNLPAKMAYARSLSASGLLPREYQGKPENLLWAIEYADMLGLPPMVAVTGIHVMQGKPTASAALIATLVRRAGHKLRTVRIENGATSTLIRADDPDHEHTATFTLDDAKAAGLLSNDNWKKRPLVMCEWRSITAVARLAASEALFGVQYTPEELGAEVTPDGVPIVTRAPARPVTPQARPRTVIEAVQQREQQTPPAVNPLDGFLVEVNLAETLDELRQLWPQIGDLPEPDREAAQEAVTTRREQLTTNTTTGEILDPEEYLDGEVVA